MTGQYDSENPKRDIWRQLFIVILSSLVLAATCCGGGLALAQSSGSLSKLGTILLVVGAGSLAVSGLTILSAVVLGIVEFFRGAGR